MAALVGVREEERRKAGERWEVTRVELMEEDSTAKAKGAGSVYANLRMILIRTRVRHTNKFPSSDGPLLFSLYIALHRPCESVEAREASAFRELVYARPKGMRTSRIPRPYASSLSADADDRRIRGAPASALTRERVETTPTRPRTSPGLALLSSAEAGATSISPKAGVFTFFQSSGRPAL